MLHPTTLLLLHAAHLPQTLRPSPLDCGTTGDPGTDSVQLVSLFAFVKTVCCEQQWVGT